MAFLTLNGTTIKCRMRDERANVEEFGDEGAAHDGTWLTRLRAKKETIPLITPWLTSAEATTHETVLYSAPPATASGDLYAGTPTSVVVRIIARHVRKQASRFAYEFELREA